MGPQYQDHRPAARSGDETCTGGTRKTQPWNNFLAPPPGHEPGTSSTQRYISFDCDTLLPDPFQFNFEGTLSPELEKFNHLKKKIT